MSYLYRFGQFALDLKRRSLTYNDSLVPLTPKAFDILVFLVQNPNRVVTKEELLKAVWADTFVEEGNLTQNISLLRKALAEKSEDNRFIVTIARKGYQFAADVDLTEGLGIVKQGGAQIPTSDISTAGMAVEAEAGDEGLRNTLVIPGAPRVEAPSSKRESRRRRVAILSAVAVILVAAGYVLWRRFHAAVSPASQRIMLAVLPFRNLTGDPNLEYLSDGLTEDLIAQLGRMQPEQLGVIARTSVMSYRRSDKRLDQIGHELSVQYVLESSIRRGADRLRITVQLVQVKDQSHLWAESYDYTPEDVLGLEKNVGAAVAREIERRLIPQQQAHPIRLHPVNSAAFDAYLEGRYFFARSSGKDDLDRATSYYERAIKLDSSYAPAWVGLSQALGRQADKGFVPHEDGYQRARKAVERAMELDPNLAEAHSQMGWIKLIHDWDWAGADASFQHALALAPGNSTIVSYASLVSEILGRLDKSLELDQQAVELDPLNALSRGIMAQHYYYVGRLKESAESLKKTLELNPDLPHAHQMLGLVYLMAGRPQEALSEIERESEAGWRLQGLALVYHAMGRRNEAEAALAEYITKYQNAGAYQIAEVYAYFGKTNQAFEWLDRAYAQRDGGLSSIKVAPLLRNLHDDPRYIALLEKMRLPLGKPINENPSRP